MSEEGPSPTGELSRRQRFTRLLVPSRLRSAERERQQFTTTGPEILPALDATQINAIKTLRHDEIYSLDQLLKEQLLKEGLSFSEFAQTFNGTAVSPIFEQIQTWIHDRGTSPKHAKVVDSFSAIKRRLSKNSGEPDETDYWHIDDAFPDPVDQEIWRVLWTDVNPTEFPNGTFVTSRPRSIEKDDIDRSGHDLTAKAGEVEKKSGLVEVPNGSILLWRRDSGVHRRPQLPAGGTRNEVSFTFSIPKETASPAPPK